MALKVGALSSGLERAIQRSRGSGQPLDGPVQEQMEQSFGRSFQDVRVHTNARADQLNRSLQARAFTTQNDIFFRQGEYKPDSQAGRHLLAHELTHVAHQGGAPLIQRASKNEKTPVPYNPLVRGALGKPTKDLDLEEAQEQAGSIDPALPDWTDRGLEDQQPDSFVITLAAAQENDEWWKDTKAIKKTILRKVFQSPRKLIKKMIDGEGEEYIAEKILKKRGELVGLAQDKIDEKIKSFSDDFHSVGHVWIRLSTRVGTQLRDLYNFWC